MSARASGADWPVPQRAGLADTRGHGRLRHDSDGRPAGKSDTWTTVPAGTHGVVCGPWRDEHGQPLQHPDILVFATQHDDDLVHVPVVADSVVPVVPSGPVSDEGVER